MPSHRTRVRLGVDATTRHRRTGTLGRRQTGGMQSPRQRNAGPDGIGRRAGRPAVTAYPDTSSLVKLYVSEVGTDDAPSTASLVVETSQPVRPYVRSRTRPCSSMSTLGRKVADSPADVETRVRVDPGHRLVLHEPDYGLAVEVGADRQQREPIGRQLGGQLTQLRKRVGAGLAPRRPEVDENDTAPVGRQAVLGAIRADDRSCPARCCPRAASEAAPAESVPDGAGTTS